MHEKQMKETVRHERSIDLARVFKAVVKKLWLIILVAVLCGMAVFAFAKLFMTPVYRSSFTAYVNNRPESQNAMTSSDITTSKNLTYVYQEIILSRSVLMSAAEQCGMDVTYSELKENVSTTVSSNAAIITVSVSAADPKEAEQLAQAIAILAPENVARVVDGSAMRIIDSPILPENPYAPNSARLAALGMMVAFLLGAAIVILMDIVVDNVESAKELEDRYSIAVVGVIPDMAHADKYEYGTYGAYASKHRRN